jgi:hypothetical protein
MAEGEDGSVGNLMGNVVQRVLTVGSVQVGRLLRWLFLFLLLLIVIPSGSVTSAPLNIAASGFLAIAALAVLTHAVASTVRRPYLIAFAISLLLAAWIVIQAIGFDGNPLANPIWLEAKQIYGEMPQSISVSPGDTMQGLIIALLPFAVFMTVLLLFRNDREVFILFRAIAIPGIVICLVGIIQFAFFPDRLLFDVKRYYLNALTAVFVNRNTAATYFAMLLVVCVGLAFHHLQNGGLRSLVRFTIGASNETKGRDALAIFLYTAGAAIIFIASMLTKSRAGIASGMVGLSVMIAILAYHGRGHLTARYGFSARRTPLWKKLLRAASVVVVLFLIGAIFAGQVILRAGTLGTSDLRFCFFPTLLEMVKDYWLFGSGFATFRDVFPAYRNPVCGMEGALTRAHNFYLEGWITLGLPFLLFASVALVGLFYYLIKGIRERRQYRWIPAAGLGVLILQLMHNTVDFSLQNPGVAAVFSALMGGAVVVANGRPAKSRSKPSGTPTVQTQVAQHPLESAPDRPTRSAEP